MDDILRPDVAILMKQRNDAYHRENEARRERDELRNRVEALVSSEQRIERVERVLLGFMALITGEAQAVARSQEELEILQAQLAKDCEAIRDSWK